MKPLFYGFFALIMLQSCSTKKQILYVQDVGKNENLTYAFSES